MFPLQTEIAIQNFPIIHKPMTDVTAANLRVHLYGLPFTLV